MLGNKMVGRDMPPQPIGKQQESVTLLAFQTREGALHTLNRLIGIVEKLNGSPTSPNNGTEQSPTPMATTLLDARNALMGCQKVIDEIENHLF